MAHSLPLRSAPTIVYFDSPQVTSLVLLPQPPLREKFDTLVLDRNFVSLQALSKKNFVSLHFALLLILNQLTISYIYSTFACFNVCKYQHALCKLNQSVNFSKQVEDVIADFRALPRTMTESEKHAPVQLNSVLKLLEEKYRLEKPSSERTLVENWNEIFGSLAGRCHPLSIREEKTLLISVANQTLRSELQFRKRSILKKIQTLPYCESITELVIRA